MTTDALRAMPAPSRAIARSGPPLATVTALSALLLGALGDYLLRGGPPGLGFGVWLTAIVIALELLSRAHDVAWTPTQRLLVLPMLFFGESIAWRDAGMLDFMNLVSACIAAGILATSLYRGPDWDVAAAGIRDYARACLGTAVTAAGGSAPLIGSVISERSAASAGAPARRARAVFRSVALALPLLLVFGGLLMSADPVFNYLITDIFSFDIENAFFHAVTALALAWPLGGWLRGALMARTGPTIDERPLAISVGTLETASILGTLNALFLAFVGVQARYLFGGESLVRATAGMTYAEYARSGFFELVFVVLLAMPVILLTHELLRRDAPRVERVWRWLAGTMLVLLGVIMVSALQRMRMYVQAYGLTEERVYATAFMAWLALTFACLALTVLRGRPRRFGIGALVSGWAVVAALDVVSPDVVIARTNLARRATTERFDGAYLASLGAEAVPVVLGALPTVQGEERCKMANGLMRRWQPRKDEDWRSWNRSRARAMALVAARERELREMSCGEATQNLSTASPAWWEHVGPESPPAADEAAANAPAIERTVADFYSAMSYGDGAFPNWTRVRARLTPGATIFVDDTELGPMTVRSSAGWTHRTGLTRTERSHTLTVRGKYAQVASVYETRRTRDGLVFGQSTALFELVRMPDGQWQIAALAWDPAHAQIAGSPVAH